jgi:hypothetical protein
VGVPTGRSGGDGSQLRLRAGLATKPTAHCVLPPVCMRRWLL